MRVCCKFESIHASFRIETTSISARSVKVRTQMPDRRPGDESLPETSSDRCHDMI